MSSRLCPPAPTPSTSIVSSRMSRSIPFCPEVSAISLSSQFRTTSRRRSCTASRAASFRESVRFTLARCVIFACATSFSSRTLTSSSSERPRFWRTSCMSSSRPSVSPLIAFVTRVSSSVMTSSAAFALSMAFSASWIGRTVSLPRSYSIWLLSLSACVLKSMRCSATSCACRSCVSSYSRMLDTPTARENSSKIRSMISLMRRVSFWICTSRSRSLV
mmetsp:Transcript_23119/g.50670  ORF Transcript_23119/g.50670 Transcript_23119/m.50670 type:complete len:218 (-) Transcript_23119:2418-3071(-)